MSTNDTLPRRTLLRTALVASAASGLALLAGCEGSDDGLVRSDGGPADTGNGLRNDGSRGTTPAEGGGTSEAAKGDISILNGMVATEYGLVDAYAAGATILGAPAADDPLTDLAPVLLAAALTFHDHHVAHADALRTAIVALGGTPLAPSSVEFVAPTGFTATVANVLKLACNAERAAAISYVMALGHLSTATNRALVASIEGDETQHFMVHYAVLNGLVDPGPNLNALTAGQLVPTAFVAAGAGGQSLEDIPDFDVTT
jgi:hypothetical protein